MINAVWRHFCASSSLYSVRIVLHIARSLSADALDLKQFHLATHRPGPPAAGICRLDYYRVALNPKP